MRPTVCARRRADYSVPSTDCRDDFPPRLGLLPPGG
jgi:hypothetical protein